MHCTSKTLVFVVLLLATVSLAFAFPTYTATPGEADGTYGPTDIRTEYYDETGLQLFDGQYGTVDWMYRHPVTSFDDYYAQYASQNGYGFSWVGWRYSIPVITINVGYEISFEQIGVHACKENHAGTNIPGSIQFEFSTDGLNFSEPINEPTWAQNWPDDNAYWCNTTLSQTKARYVRITLERSVWVLIDEFSINGMDGAQFPVPEPSSFLALGALSIPLLFRRRR